MTWIDDIDIYEVNKYENVKIVSNIISEDNFRAIFPLRSASYEYKYFLRAIA